MSAPEGNGRRTADEFVAYAAEAAERGERSAQPDNRLQELAVAQAYAMLAIQARLAELAQILTSRTGR